MRERIGSYRIEKVLAHGGMGLVYKGRHETLGRDAAIKTLLPKSAGDAALRHRLLREAQAQARLQHPNVVAVYDFIDDHDELFIAMEYVEGETLAALLDRSPRQRLTYREALPLLEQVLDALEYVHNERIVHRDVKPSNVMVCGSRVKLADFGIALLNDEPRLTASLHLIGSPPYMSPEQLQTRSIDHRSDLYSAALVLYRMVSGRPPFEAKEYLAQIHERMVGPPDLRSLVPELPVGVCEAVAIALRHDPEQRFHSAGAFRDALREGVVGFLVTSPPPVEAEVKTEVLTVVHATPSHRPAVAAGLVVAGGLAAASLVFQQRPGRPPFPEKAPASPQLVVSRTIPAPVILEAPAPSVQPPAEPAKDEPPKAVPFPAPKPAPVEDEEAKRGRELSALRDAIRAGLARAETDLGLQHFDTAIEGLDRVAAMAQRYAFDLQDERAQIAELRTRVTDARVAMRTSEAQAALWASRLSDIEEDLRAERWPEAERFAKNITDDPRAPDAITARARALLQQAREGFRSAFSDTTLGPNSNKIRKPSSPPRKEH